jgi:hypothetical protein
MGCAKDDAACKSAISGQVLSVLDTAVTIGSAVVTAGGSVAGKAVGGTIAKAGVKAGVKKLTEKAASAAIKTALKKGLTKYAAKTGTKVALGVKGTTALVKGFTAAREAEVFDFTALDPTGIASIVKAYNHPICK